MNTNSDIKALREEIARLRERIAVLESRPAYVPMPAPVQLPPAISPWAIPVWPSSPGTTCAAGQAGMRQS